MSGDFGPYLRAFYGPRPRNPCKRVQFAPIALSKFGAQSSPKICFHPLPKIQYMNVKQIVPVLNPLFLGIAANLEESVKIGVWGYFRMLNPKFNRARQKKFFFAAYCSIFAAYQLKTIQNFIIFFKGLKMINKVTKCLSYV